MHADNITKLSIEWVRTVGNTTLREIQHSIIDDNGILVSYTTNYVRKGSGKLTVAKSTGTLQLYTAQERREMLTKNGFNVLEQTGMDGSKFFARKTERILMIAQKQPGRS